MAPCPRFRHSPPCPAGALLGLFDSGYLFRCLQVLPRFPGASRADFGPILNAPSGTPGFAGRVLSGSAPLPPLRDRLRRPPARWCGSATGERHAGLLPACRPPIRRLMVGRFAPAAVSSGSVFPHDSVGGKTGRFAEAVAASPRLPFGPPPPPPAGVRGRKGKKGIAVFLCGSRWSPPDRGYPASCVAEYPGFRLPGYPDTRITRYAETSD